MLIITLIGIVISQEIYWTNYSFESPEFINLIAYQTSFARSFEEYGQILNFTIEYDSQESEELCSFEYQYLIFDKIINSLRTFVDELQSFDIDELETKQIEYGFSDQLIGYSKNDLNLLLLEKNGVIHSLNFDENSKQFNHSKLTLQIYSDNKQHEQLINDRDAFYYINNEQFSKFIIQTNQLYQFEIQNWNQQYDTFKIQVRNNNVYLMNKNELIIYKIIDHTLVEMKNLFAKDIYKVDKRMNLVDTIIQEGYLYILDRENGVKRLRLDDNEIDNDFFIDQADCQMISIEKKSVILIQQNQQRQIVYEGILNNRGWTLLQSKQTFKKTIKSIKQLNNYAILLSNPINNIHRKYMIDSLANKEMIEGTNFYQMDFLGMESIDNNYVIGIFKYGIVLYYVIEQPSAIVCSFQMPTMSRIKIQMISTQCPNSNKSDLLNYCNSELEYIFDIRGALMDEVQERIFIYLCVGASIIVTLLAVSIIYVIRRYQLQKQYVDEMKRKRIKQKK